MILGLILGVTTYPNSEVHMRVSDVPGLKLKELDRFHNVELLSKVQDLLLEMTVAFKDGIPVCVKAQDDHADALLIANSLIMELQCRMIDTPPGYSENSLALANIKMENDIEVLAVVAQKFREESSKKEWAMLSKSIDTKTGKRKVLFWLDGHKPVANLSGSAIIGEDGDDVFNKEFVKLLKSEFNSVHTSANGGEVKLGRFSMKWQHSNNDPAIWVELTEMPKVKAILDAKLVVAALLKLEDAVKKFDDSISI